MSTIESQIETYQQRYTHSKKLVGTMEYDGVAYFHNHHYRFLLRSPGDYQEWKGLKCCPSSRWWEKKMRTLHNAMLMANLIPWDVSPAHDELIKQVFGVDYPPCQKRRRRRGDNYYMCCE